MASAISKFIKRRVKCAKEAAAKEAAFASLTAEKEAEDAKTQYMLDNAQDKGGLVDALMVIDWRRVDLKYIAALLSKHDVSIDDLIPLLQRHFEKLADVDIDKSCIKYNELTQCDMNVPNASLKAWLLIIFANQVLPRKR
jgi:hypothetical protein